MSKQLPDKLVNFMVYEKSKGLIGLADITMPDVSMMSDTLKGAGIPGEIDMPVIGHTQSMTTTINWKILMQDNIRFTEIKAYTFDCWASEQSYDDDKGEISSMGLRVVMKCIPKKFGLGKLDVATSVDTNGEFEVVYIKILMNQEAVLEIDKANFIYKVNGVDSLSEVRAQMGIF